ncbi:serine protease [Oryzibacter oryziterrae]|uniref:serine protease n=1 Tax=Oryzibacter oryziterrae TaxID=2766474 RepID=UPI001F42AFC6|nr:serine protease [Oryzibacter oryziterrae]
MSFVRKSLLALAIAGLSLSQAFASGASNTGSAQIIGGTTAPKGKWPFQVHLEVDDTDGSAWFCGGTLIKSNYVLTAAHCITREDNGVVPASTVFVLAGTQNLESGGKVFKGAAVYRHPKYNPKTMDYDLAVIKLNKPVTGIKPIALIKPAQESTLAAVNDKSFVIGWGNMSTKDDNFPTLLQQVQVPILSRAKCNSATSYDGEITPRMFCAGTFAGGKDSCQGDSGGPLIVADASGAFKLQAGVVSWGYGCARKNLPGVYTRLALPEINNWVKAKIGQ